MVEDAEVSKKMEIEELLEAVDESNLEEEAKAEIAELVRGLYIGGRIR